MTKHPLDHVHPKTLLAEYLEFWPEEAHELAVTYELMSAFPAFEDLICRNNMAGHITASGLILDESKVNVLLIEHPTLHKLLPPGGHVEMLDLSPMQAAYREIFEETGVEAAELMPLLNATNQARPVDVNVHWIPENPSKGEVGHYHHDFRFLFQYVGTKGFPRKSPEGGEGIDWYPLEGAFPESDQNYLVDKIVGLLNQQG